MAARPTDHSSRPVRARAVASLLVLVAILLAGCAGTDQAQSSTTDTPQRVTPTSVASEPPADPGPSGTAGPRIIERNDVAATADRGRDPAVVCHWAGGRYVTLVVSVQGAEAGHGNHELDVIYLYTDDETLCDELTPPVTTTTTALSTTTVPSTTTAPSTTTPPSGSTTTSPPSETTTIAPTTTTPPTESTTTTSSFAPGTSTSTTLAPTTTTPPSGSTTVPPTTVPPTTVPPTTVSPSESTTPSPSTTTPGTTTSTLAPGTSTSSTSEAPGVTTTAAPGVGAGELPYTGVNIPVGVLVVVGLGLMLAGLFLLRVAKES